MSNETKRDVFNQLLSEYVDDELRIDGLVYEPDQHIWELDREYFINSYAAALPDDLPVIPEDVSEWLTWCKMKHNSLKDALDGETRVSEDIFASAWLLGVWRVEETGEIVKLEAAEHETKKKD